LLDEVRHAEGALLRFISSGIGELSRLGGIDYAIKSSGSVRTNPGREKLVHERMNTLSKYCQG